VDLADLSQLSADALETLKNTEFKEYRKALSTETKEITEVKKLNAEYKKNVQTVEVILSRYRLLLPPPEHVRNNFTF
jgi:hypothetical protein